MEIIAAVSVSLMGGVGIGLYSFALMLRTAARRNGGAYVFYATPPQHSQEARVFERPQHQGAGLVFGK